MTKRVFHSCHACGGNGSALVTERGRLSPIGDASKPCRWCNGTGDEDYQDRAYEQSRDFADDKRGGYDD